MQVLCLPLDAVLNPLGIWHVNFFVLDVEGAELAVLKAIDFSRLSFDVLCVEADGMSPEKDAAVRVSAALCFATPLAHTPLSLSHPPYLIPTTTTLAHPPLCTHCWTAALEVWVSMR